MVPFGATGSGVSVIATVIAACLPEQAIVVDESVTSGRNLGPVMAGAAPHDVVDDVGGIRTDAGHGRAARPQGRKVMPDAAALLDALVLDDEFAEFLTLGAYPLLG